MLLQWGPKPCPQTMQAPPGPPMAAVELLLLRRLESAQEHITLWLAE